MLSFTEKLVLLGLISNVIVVLAVCSLGTDVRELMGRICRGRRDIDPTLDRKTGVISRLYQTFINKTR